MSGKLDQSLDEIATSQRRAAGRRRQPRRAASRAAPAPAAPAGGIKKHTKPARNAGAKAVPAKAGPLRGESKIIVSNLPKDVTEPNLKEYFVKTVGPIKRADIVYGPNSVSRGIANITFRDPAGASIAFQKCNGLHIDDRPIKVEIVVGAGQVDKVLPAVKTLEERTTKPKNQAKAQPKSAAADKKKNAAKAGGAKATAQDARGRNARPAKKTEAELDSEMTDYFKAPNDNATGGANGGSGEAMEEIE